MSDTDGKDASPSATPAKEETAASAAPRAEGARPASADAEPARAEVPGPVPGLGRGSVLAVWLLTALIAALVGGSIGALWGPGPVSDAELAAANPAFASRIAELSSAIAEAREDFDALEKRVAEVGDATEAVGDRVPDNLRQALGEIDDRLDGVEDAVESLSGLPTPEEGQDNNVILRLNEEVASLRRDLEATRTAVGGRLDALETVAPPADLDARLRALAERSQVSALEARVGTLEQTSNDGKRAALALALANLSRAAERGEPFAAELNAMTILAPGRVPVARLQPFAEHGLPTRAALANRFSDIVGDALKADRIAGAQSWWQRIWARIVSLVTVRRTGELEGDSTQAVLARAEMRLTEGNLEAASRELHALDAAAAERVMPFLAELDAKLELDKLSATLTAETLAGIAD